jgi:hypothetical protein
MFGLGALCTFLESAFSSLRKTQRVNLGLCLRAILSQCRPQLSGMARFFPQCRHHRHRVKRVYRFLSNDRVDPQALFVRFLRAWFDLDRRTEPLPILLDDTQVWGTWYALVAAIPFRGRALPLAWTVYDRSTIRHSQNRLEEAFLQRLLGLLAPLRIVVIADRAFGRASFARFLAKLQADFVRRIKAATWVETPCAQGPALSYAPTPTRTRLYDNARYHRTARVPVSLVVAHSHRAAEPWFLVTSLDAPVRVRRLYERRMTIEESFRDLKSRLHLPDATFHSAARIERVLLVLALAYVLLTHLGAQMIRRYGQQAYVASKSISAYAVGQASAIVHPKLLIRLLADAAHALQTG